MLAQWTGCLVGQLHVNEISAKELAAEAGINPKYMSAILNGRRTPADAEQRLNDALERLIRKKQGTKSGVQ